MDVKCPGCYKITTVFSHAQTVVLCVGCSTVLCQPTGGRARLTEGRIFKYLIYRFINFKTDLSFVNLNSRNLKIDFELSIQDSPDNFFVNDDRSICYLSAVQ